jgi:hypothetical protein
MEFLLKLSNSFLTPQKLRFVVTQFRSFEKPDTSNGKMSAHRRRAACCLREEENAVVAKDGRGRLATTWLGNLPLKHFRIFHETLSFSKLLLTGMLSLFSHVIHISLLDTIEIVLLLFQNDLFLYYCILLYLLCISSIILMLTPHINANPIFFSASFSFYSCLANFRLFMCHL